MWLCVSVCLWVWDHGHKTIRVSLLRLFCRLNEFQNDSKNGKRLYSRQARRGICEIYSETARRGHWPQKVSERPEGLRGGWRIAFLTLCCLTIRIGPTGQVKVNNSETTRRGHWSRKVSERAKRPGGRRCSHENINWTGRPKGPTIVSNPEKARRGDCEINSETARRGHWSQKVSEWPTGPMNVK